MDGVKIKISADMVDAAIDSGDFAHDAVEAAIDYVGIRASSTHESVVATAAVEVILAESAVEGIVSSATEKGVATFGAEKGVFAVVSEEAVGIAIAASTKIRRTAQRGVFDIAVFGIKIDIKQRSRLRELSNEQICRAAVEGFHHLVASFIDKVGVVALTSEHAVDTATAVEDIATVATDKSIGVFSKHRIRINKSWQFIRSAKQDIPQRISLGIATIAGNYHIPPKTTNKCIAGIVSNDVGQVG